MKDISIEKNGIFIPVAQIELISGKEQVVLGDYERDLILRTKGNIKVQIGNKFFDLNLSASQDSLVINNSSGTSIIVVDTDADLPQSPEDDTLVFVKDTKALYVVVDSILVPVSQNINDGNGSQSVIYLSYKQSQSLTGLEKFTAQLNIGNIQKNLSDISAYTRESVYDRMVVFCVEDGKYYQLIDSNNPSVASSWKELFLSLRTGGVVEGKVAIGIDGSLTDLKSALHVQSEYLKEYLDKTKDFSGLTVGSLDLSKGLATWLGTSNTIYFANLATDGGFKFIEDGTNPTTVPSLSIANHKVGIGTNINSDFTLTVGGDTLIQDRLRVRNAVMSEDPFLQGASGSGFSLYKNFEDKWNLEVDNIYVRNRITSKLGSENKTRGVNGQLWFSNSNSVANTNFIESIPVFVKAKIAGRYYDPGSGKVKVPIAQRGVLANVIASSIPDIISETQSLPTYQSMHLYYGIGNQTAGAVDVNYQTWNKDGSNNYSVVTPTHKYNGTDFVEDPTGDLVLNDVINLYAIELVEDPKVLVGDLLIFRSWTAKEIPVRITYGQVVGIDNRTLYVYVYANGTVNSDMELVVIGDIAGSKQTALIDATEENPSETYIDGISTFNDLVEEVYYGVGEFVSEATNVDAQVINPTKINTKFGQLAKITHNDLLLDGTSKYGLYSKSAYIEGSAVVKSGKVGELYILDGKLLTRTGITDRSQFTTNGDEFYNTSGSGLYIDAKNNRFSLGDRLRYSGNILTLHTLLVDGTTSAVASFVRGSYLNSTLVATANGDLLIGADFSPIFNTGIYTGCTLLAARFNGNISPNGDNLYVNGASNANWSAVRTRVLEATTGALVVGTTTAQNLDFKTNTITNGRLFASGNWLFQKGGTLTDSGYQLDVVSTSSAVNARFKSTNFANLDLWSDRVSGNIGGLRFFDSASAERAEIISDTFGAVSIANSSSGAVSTKFKVLAVGAVILDGTGGYTDDGSRLQVVGNQTALSGVARISSVKGNVIAAANNDTLIGVDYAPTFNMNSFTGVTNIGLRVTASTTFGILVRNPDPNSRSAILAQDSGSTKYIEITIKGTTSSLDGTYGTNGEGVLRSSTSATGMALSTVTGNLRFITGVGTEQARMFANGNWVLNGTTDNGYKLDIFGQTRITSTSSAVLTVQTADTTQFSNALFKLSNTAPAVSNREVQIGLENAVAGGGGTSAFYMRNVNSGLGAYSFLALNLNGNSTETVIGSAAAILLRPSTLTGGSSDIIRFNSTKFGPDNSGIFDLGSAGQPWKDFYTSGTTVRFTGLPANANTDTPLTMDASGNVRKGNVPWLKMEKATLTDVNAWPVIAGDFKFQTFDRNGINGPVTPSNDANGVLTMMSHSSVYGKQILFLDNDDLYIRKISANAAGTWRKIWSDSSLTNLNQLTTRLFSDLQSKPTTLAGYGITDAIQNQSAADQAASMRINGTITVGNYNKILVNNLGNTAQGINAGLLSQGPFGAVWHDLFGFCKAYTPTFETSVDGVAWVSGTLDKRLFAQKQAQSITVLNPATTAAVRWTWSSASFSFSSGVWMVIGHSYTSPAPSKTVIVETSVDGIVWTNRHTSTYTNVADDIYHFINNYGGDSYYRITMSHNSATATINLNSIKLLSNRPGDQGLGIELKYPYTWDELQNITLAGNLTTGFQIRSNVASGTAPFTVLSATAVTNLNADLLDGQHGSFYQNAGNINAGTLAIARGGTNLTAMGTALQHIRVNAAGTSLEYATPTSIIMNGSGVSQFNYSLDTGLQFAGSGDTTVSFDATNKRITITSIPGSGGGGAVTSFNGRTGGVSATEGDYSLNLLGDVTIASVANNQLLKYNSGTTQWENWTPSFVSASNFATDYISSALPDGSTTAFNTSSNYISGTTRVFLNGLRMYKGATNDYTETAANVITFNFAPIAGDLIIIDYQK